MKGTVKEVLGSALSIGCTIEHKSPKEVTASVAAGRASVAALFGIDNINSLPEFLDD